ncbi:nuclear pore complex protein DDB_G0274915 isoform X2 [Camponotus floridanus]|uniref:nuclear pore complex protein DDB_G0274915 isoform X2 n=1 Tax=Camponotus floridanus TaxID=104421 RepID=UPI000DC68408|nr:nuclear pore complex protein DDB_G0274915 isoform X2 [Camponotus floridanus]
MVICKYYRQGICRYGQYCQFEHINNFGNTKAEHNEDDIAVTVAKEVLLAERGGQWLLSCFGPFRDRPIIPGMQDLSPEEVRYEMYEAQKNGLVEQAKLHFQQLCQDMKAKREALKNPTRETITMLKRILGSSQKAPHLGLVNSASTNNVFGNKTFGVQNNNPFGGGGFTSSSNTSSIFGKSNNNSTVFGSTAPFGNNLGGFTTATNTNSFFGGTANTSTSFNNVQNNTPPFGTPQNNSIFGTSTPQTVFGQNNNVFGSTNQLGNASSTSLFNNPMTSQANTSLFGGATTTTANLFGTSSSGLQTNSVFGASTTSSGSSFSGGLFNQSKTQMPAFGGAPVFGGVTSNYANNSSGNSIFGVNQTFGATTSGIFGGSTTATAPAFGVSTTTTTSVFGTSIATTTAPAFGTSVTTTPAFDLNQQHGNNTFGTTVSAPNVFGSTQNTDSTMSGNSNAPFGTSITAGPFVTVNSQQYDSANASSTSFTGTGFGIAVASTNNTFGTTETSSNSIFANAGTTFATSNATIPNPAFPTSTFGNINVSSSTSSTTLTTTTNPFAPRTQQGTPFGSVAQVQSNAIDLSSPFGKSPFNATTNTVIDDTVYSVEGVLTDDEKSMYLAEKFIIGKIPLKPPTKDIR